MKSLLVQFHAVPEEILDFVKSVSRDLGLVVVVMVLKPFKIELIDNLDKLEEILAQKREADIRIALKAGEIDLTAKSPNNFFDLNSDCITVDIGTLSARALNESSLSFQSDSTEAFRTANKVANKLKKFTKSGAIAVNPDTGAEAKIRSHRYTEMAKQKYDEGIKILPVAGKNLFKLTD